MRKRWARLLGVGLLAGAAYAAWRAFDARARSGGLEWRPEPLPSPPRPVPQAATPAAAGTTVGRPHDTSNGPGLCGREDAPWVAPTGDACPATHPVKAKLARGIYHTPGGQMYDRTVPDRCYRDPAAAEADGLRASKR